MGNSIKSVDDRDLHYSRQRQRNRVFTAVVSFFSRESEKRHISKRDIAEALGKDPSQITRWLTQPSNITLDSISDLLLALDAEMDIRIVKFEDRAPANYTHPLLVQIQAAEIEPHQNIRPPLVSERQRALLRLKVKQASTTDQDNIEITEDA